MKELIEYIAKSLASNPDEVKVTEVSDEDGQIVLSWRSRKRIRARSSAGRAGLLRPCACCCAFAR